MAQQLIDKRDMNFVIWDQMEFQEALKYESFAEFKKKLQILFNLRRTK